jgi:hypothetical protein
MNETDSNDTGKSDASDAEVKIFHRINRLREKAGGSRYGSGNGQFDTKVMQQAHRAVEQLAPEYPKTVSNDLDKLVEATQQLLTAKPDEQQPTLQYISTLANEVQSLGATFGFNLITAFGQSLRRFTDNMGHADESQLVLIRAHVDTIRVVLTRGIHGDGGEEGRALIEELKKALRKHGGETSAAALEEILNAVN